MILSNIIKMNYLLVDYFIPTFSKKTSELFEQTNKQVLKKPFGKTIFFH